MERENPVPRGRWPLLLFVWSALRLSGEPDSRCLGGPERWRRQNAWAWHGASFLHGVIWLGSNVKMSGLIEFKCARIQPDAIHC